MSRALRVASGHLEVRLKELADRVERQGLAAALDLGRPVSTIACEASPLHQPEEA
jgi:hypothetical protein